MNEAPTKQQECMARGLALLLIKPRKLSELLDLAGGHNDTMKRWLAALEAESLIKYEPAPKEEGRVGRPPMLITWKGGEK